MRNRHARKSVLSRRRRNPAPVAAEVLEDRTLLSGTGMWDLDSDFSTDGLVAEDISGSDLGSAIVAYEHGGAEQVLVVGGTGGASGDMVVARYDDDGSLDTSFDGDGIATVFFGADASSSFEVALDVIVDTDGSILVVGTTDATGSRDIAVARLSGTDGSVLWKSTIDFGTTTIPTIDEGRSIALDSTGNILVGGDSVQSGQLDFVVARLEGLSSANDGMIDTTFGNSGVQIIDFGGVGDFNPVIAVDSAGRTYIAGEANLGGLPGKDFAIARLTNTGAHDLTFDGDGPSGADGLTFVDFGNTSDTATGIVIDSDGSVLVGGYSSFDFAIARLDSTGSLVTTFGISGKATVNIGGTDFAFDLELDGSDILISGESAGDYAVLRLSSSGSVDSTFGPGGIQTVSFGGSDRGFGVDVDAQGRVLLSGTTDVGANPDNIGVARLAQGGTNTPPVADAGGPYTADEGDSFQLDATASDDPDPDHAFGDLTFEWDLNYDGTFDPTPGVTGATPTVSFPDDASLTVAVRVTDPCGDSHIAVTTITINNVAPSSVVVDGPSSGVRGQTLDYSVDSFIDPGADSHEFEWSVLKDGDPFTLPAGTVVNLSDFSFTPTEIGEYTVSVEVTDDDDGVGNGSQATDIEVAAIQGNDLVVGGTPGNDKIRVTPGDYSGEVDVKIDNTFIGTFTPTSRIIVHGYDGDDNVVVAGGITISAWLFGGDGDDKLKGAKGDDVIVGGNGDDLIKGRAGRDLLIGGDGADRIVGNKDEDILIAASTTIDNDLAELQVIMDEWVKPDPFEDRVAVVSGLLDGKVVDDDDADKLTGGQGLDWFVWNDEDDRITDLNDCSFEGDLDWILNEGEDC